MCFKKIISVLTFLIFLSTNIVYAAPGSRSVFKNKKVDHKKISTEQAEAIDKKKAVLRGETVDREKEASQKKEAQRILSSHLGDLSQVHIPQEIGRVIEVYEAPGSEFHTKGENRLIVHIQDLHTNPEGEFNLAKILEILLKDYNLGLVCSEGADGVVDTSSVSNFPDPAVREKVANLFVNSGELTGEEYLSITKYPDMPIWGIENKDIYFKNIEEFNRIMKFNPDSQVFISQAKKSLDELKPRIYSKEILSIDQKETDYANQKIETTDYLKYLSSYIQKLNIPTADYKNVTLLNETIIQESKIDQQKIMQESQNLLINLQSVIADKSNRSDIDTLMAKASLFKDQKISPFSFYSYLKDLANKHLKDQISRYSNLTDFVDYLTKVNSLDSTKLFVEMEDLTYDIKQRLARNDEERNLTQSIRNIKFLEGFFNLKISNEELDYYLQHKDSHQVSFFEAFLKPAINKYNLANYIDFNPNLIDAHLQEIEDFYKTVKQRDLAMFNNTVNEVEKRNVKVAAFISGGFHTKGVTRLLKDRGYSYIVISPYSKTDIDEENYHFLLSGKRKPIEDLIKQLDVPQVASNSSSQKLRVPLAFDPNISSKDGNSGDKAGENRLGAVLAKIARSLKPVLTDDLLESLSESGTGRVFQIGRCAINEKGGSLKVFIPSNKGVGVVVKVARKGFADTLLSTYVLAKNSLGTLGAKVTLVRDATFYINGQNQHFDFALIQEETTPLDNKLKELVRSGKLDAAKRLLDAFFECEKGLYRLGLHDMDHKFESYGVTSDGRVVLFDYTSLSDNKDEFYLKSTDDSRNLGLRNMAFVGDLSRELAGYFHTNEIKSYEFDSLWASDIGKRAILPNVDIARLVFTRTGASLAAYSSWQEFERAEIDSREFDQRQKNLSAPQRVAFNIDAFPANDEVSTIRGLHRIFDSMFRLLEGNPNFTPVAIFLNDYAEGMPSSFERLARFLQANPATGKAKYKVKFDRKNNELIINGHRIALYKGFATSEQLGELDVNFLIEAARQKHLDHEENRPEVKEKEEVAQRARIDGYLKDSKELRVVVIAPEEDKGNALAMVPVVFKVNSAAVVTPESRMVVLAEPVTTAAGIMSNVVENTVKLGNPKAKITISEVRVVRTDRQGDRLIDVPDIRTASALSRVLRKEDTPVHAVVTDSGAIYGTANSIQMVFTVTGFVTELTADMINQAFREAGRQGLLRGLIDFKGRDTVSGFEAHNTHPLVFLPIKPEDIKVVRPANGASSRTVTLRGFYTETGYAKSALDLMTGLAIFDGKGVLQKEAEGVEVPRGVIPPTPLMVRPQVVPDGKPIPVVLNSAIGRMGKGIQRRIWFDPNFEVVGINGVRPTGKNMTALFMERDEVFEETPFTVRVNNDNTFTFRDREERVTVVGTDTIASSEIKDDGIKSTVLNTVYGNLYVEQDENGIRLMRLHGKGVVRIRTTDNKDGTFTAQGELKNGTTVRLIYGRHGADTFNSLISAGITKQEIIRFTNVRATDRNAYAQGKTEKDEDFLKRAEAYNRVFAEEVLVNMPWLNGDVLFLEASGSLIEALKLRPFYLAGAGIGVISAPAKATAKSSKATDVTIVPGVSDQYVLSSWDIIKTASCASCTTNAAAVSAKALLSFLNILSGNFDTVHALTNTQGRQFGEIPEGSKAGLDRGVDARRHIAYTSTGASSELANALQELTNIVSGVALRVGNDDGSLVNYVFHVSPKEGTEIPSAEKINELVRGLTEVSGSAGGLKGFLGYGSPKSSLEVINTGIAGIFDPSKTHVDPSTGAVSVSIWYDNEGGYMNQYINLALLMGLYRAERAREIDVVAQNVVPAQGAYTGRVSVKTAKKTGATSVIIGSGQFRAYEEEANRYRVKKVDVNGEVNRALKEALSSGIDSPILNIYISDMDQRRGVEAVINSQISEALKDIPPEDIIRITVSIEAADFRGVDEYAVMARNAVSGYAARAFMSKLAAEKDGVLKDVGLTGYKSYIDKLKAVSGGADEAEVIVNYAKLLGSNVSQKVRVVIKFNERIADSLISIMGLFKKADIDGFIFSSEFDISDINDIARSINYAMANDPDKQVELNKRRSPRFFICASAGHDLETSLPDYVNSFSSEVDSHYVQIAIAPPLTELKNLASLLKGQKLPSGKAVSPNKVPVRVLLQNATLLEGKKGEGFVNLYYAVANLGIHDVLFGHSEIIDLTGISDREIAELAKRAHELKRDGRLTGNVIVAVGETTADYDAGNSGKIVKGQVTNRLKGLSPAEIADTVIAYEPRWAIGTGRTPTNKEIQDIHAGIRNAIREEFGLEASQKVRVIYGGSVTLQNAEGILKLKDVDGALIGGASTSSETFSSIVAIAQNLSSAKNQGSASYRRLYIAGNHKAMEVKEPYTRFVGALSGVDRRKVEVAIGPELPRITELTEVYAKDPLKDIVFIDQLTPEEIKGKVFFVRVDFNVPIDDIKAEPTDPDTWKVTSDARIRGAISTINTIRKNGGIAVLVSHFDPKGVNLTGPQSIRFLVPQLESLLGDGTKIKFVGDILGSARQSTLKGAVEGDVILLENVRLDPDIAKSEKADKDTPGDIALRASLAARLYAGQNERNPKANVVVVSDGFGVMHRNQGSVTGSLNGVPRIGGNLLKQELMFGVEAIRNARHPVAIVFGGGAKVGDKVPMLKHIILNTLMQGDKIFVYGGAAIPFLMARDSSFEPGKSRTLFDNATIGMAREIMELAEEEGVEIVLPVDFVVGDNLPSDETQKVSTNIVSDSIPANKGAYDIGPKTVKRFREEILDEQGRSRFGLIIDNGPAGVFEYEQFRSGTQGIFEVMAEATISDKNPTGAVTVVGGGDTGYAAELIGVDNKLSFVSTGGGAFLELLQGLDLPGVEALRGNAGELSYHLNTNIGPAADRIRSIMSDYAAASIMAEASYNRVQDEAIKGNGGLSLSAIREDSVMLVRLAHNQPTHTRSKEEYETIAGNIGGELSAEARENVGNLLFGLGSMHKIIGGKVIRNKAVYELYKRLGLPDSFFNEDMRHEAIELDLARYSNIGDGQDIIRRLGSVLGAEKYAEFENAFFREYGTQFNYDPALFALHLISEKLDGGVYPAGIFEEVYSVLKSEYTYIASLEEKVAKGAVEPVAQPSIVEINPSEEDLRMIGLIDDVLEGRGVELAKKTALDQVDIMNQIVVVFASDVIGRESDFEAWLGAKSANVAVVMITETREENSVSKYKDRVFIKVVGRDLTEPQTAELYALKTTYGRAEFFDGINIGALYKLDSLDAYKSTLAKAAEGV